MMRLPSGRWWLGLVEQGEQGGLEVGDVDAEVGRDRRAALRPARRRRGRSPSRSPRTATWSRSWVTPATPGSRLSACSVSAVTAMATVDETGGSANRTVTSPACRATSSAGVPWSSTRPSRIATTRSHRASASSSSWVTSSTVVPASRSCATADHTSRRAAGSRPWVSSSRITSRGRLSSASTRNSRCRSPPLMPGERRPPLVREPELLEQRVAVGGPRPGEQVDGLGDPQPVRQRRSSAAGCRSAAAAGRRPGSGRGRAPGPRPASGRRSPWRISTVVVLPAPLAPIRPSTSPAWTSRSRRRRPSGRRTTWSARGP